MIRVRIDNHWRHEVSATAKLLNRQGFLMAVERVEGEDSAESEYCITDYDENDEGRIEDEMKGLPTAIVDVE